MGLYCLPNVTCILCSIVGMWVGLKDMRFSSSFAFPIVHCTSSVIDVVFFWSWGMPVICGTLGMRHALIHPTHVFPMLPPPISSSFWPLQSYAQAMSAWRFSSFAPDMAHVSAGGLLHWQGYCCTCILYVEIHMCGNLE